MVSEWVSRLGTLVSRNRPKRKPQLWENLPLAVERRLRFEIGRRINPDWIDRPHLVELSGVGFEPDSERLKMEVVPREVMNKALFLYGTFEISETRLVQSFLRPGMCFIDVGANIGYYTLLGARLVGPTGKVFSFEPNREVRERLEQNVRFNGFDNVTVLAQAMTRESGEVRFYVSDVGENSGISSIVPGRSLREAQVVPAISLDDFVAKLPPGGVALLKMDIEGAELDVLEGGERLLAGSDAPALLFESFDVTRLLPTLLRFGYHVRRLHYTLADGLALPDALAPLDSLFAAYESPNYFA